MNEHVQSLSNVLVQRRVIRVQTSIILFEAHSHDITEDDNFYVHCLLLQRFKQHQLCDFISD